jgi:hypothetical protein
LTAIAATQGASSPVLPNNNSAAVDGNLFSDFLNTSGSDGQTPSTNAAAGSTIASSTQSTLLQVQEAGYDAGSIPVTTLAGFHSSFNIAGERQFLQTFGVDFAQSMDTNGNGSVTESELVNKLTSSGNLAPALAEQLYDKLSPGDAPMTDAQLAAKSSTLFAPSWVNTRPTQVING